MSVLEGVQVAHYFITYGLDQKKDGTKPKQNKAFIG